MDGHFELSEWTGILNYLNRWTFRATWIDGHFELSEWTGISNYLNERAFQAICNGWALRTIWINGHFELSEWVGISNYLNGWTFQTIWIRGHSELSEYVGLKNYLKLELDKRVMLCRIPRICIYMELVGTYMLHITLISTVKLDILSHTLNPIKSLFLLVLFGRLFAGHWTLPYNVYSDNMILSCIHIISCSWAIWLPGRKI